MDNELIIKAMNDMIKMYRLEGKISTKSISDGYYSFGELYVHRTILFALVCNSYPDISWKSKKHYNEENDPMFNGDFVAGISTPEGDATYHIKLEYWDLFNIPELERAHPYDGHNSNDDIIRLLSLINLSKENDTAKDIKCK